MSGPYRTPGEPAEHIELGDLARDRISGFEGIVIARTQWLWGCDRLTLKPQRLHDGKPIDAVSFDLDEVTLVAKAEEGGIARRRRPPAPIPPRPLGPVAGGGPRPEPVRR